MVAVKMGQNGGQELEEELIPKLSAGKFYN